MSTPIRFINLATELLLATFEPLAAAELERGVANADASFQPWCRIPIERRAALLVTLL
jgi:acyl-CoA reductase-like NAD-dependent aldehyde dehydrogenase